jgi:ABC-type uncharacterized transport system substrate-binding protein
MNDNETGNRTPNGTKQAAAFFTERELYFHERQSTKVSARGSFPRVGVEEGYRRLACRQTVCAFDPDATTSSPTIAIYCPAKRERSARRKKSNSLLETFLRRRLAIRFILWKKYANKPWLARQPVNNGRYDSAERVGAGGQGDQMKIVSHQRSVVSEARGLWSVASYYFVLCAVLFALCSSAQAQQPAKIPRIGWLTNARFAEIPYRTEAFRQGLRELGYVEGKNIVIEWRTGNNDQVPALAAELVHLKVDVIVTAALSLTRAAKKATVTIPIVFAQDPDPIGNGFVAGLAHPGGNITGLSTLAPELNGKKLEILKEIVPRISRVAVFMTSRVRDSAPVSKEVELAAQALKMKLQYLDVPTPAEFEPAFREAIKGRAEGILMKVAGPVYIPHRKKAPELAAKNRLPVMYRRPQDVEAGGLMSYGVNVNDLDRRAAVYVDKILKGAKPADLPVEQPTKFEFVINLKAAKQIRLTIPPNVLARADRVIR